MSQLAYFNLPDVGEGLTEAEIVSWKVKPGDHVTVNQIIVEIETAKSLVELPCPFEGVVAELFAQEGETVEVGRPIISATVSDGAVGATATSAIPVISPEIAQTAHEASTFVSISSEIAARVSELAFYHLEAPPIRVGGFDVPYPAAKLEEQFLPDADRILDAIDRALAF